MPSSTSSSRLWSGLRAAPPRALAVALMIGIGLESLAWVTRPGPAERLAENRYYPPDRVPVLNESIIQWQVFDAATGEGPIDFLLLGDSSCLMGLRSEPISETIGGQGWNLGTIGLLTPLGHALIFDVFADRHGPPPLVVYHVYWRPLMSDWYYRPDGVLERFRTWQRAVFGEPAFPPSRAHRFRVRRWLVPERTRRGFEQSPRGSYPSDAEVRELLHARRGAFTETARGTLPPDLEIPAQLASRQRAALDQLVSDVVGRGSSIVLMLAPLPERARTTRNRASFEALHETFRALTDRPGAVLYEPFIRFYPDASFATEPHLTEAAAQRNSRELAEWLARRRALPPSPEEPGLPAE